MAVFEPVQQVLRLVAGHAQNDRIEARRHRQSIFQNLWDAPGTDLWYPQSRPGPRLGDGVAEQDQRAAFRFAFIAIVVYRLSLPRVVVHSLLQRLEIRPPEMVLFLVPGAVDRSGGCRVGFFVARPVLVAKGPEERVDFVGTEENRKREEHEEQNGYPHERLRLPGQNPVPGTPQLSIRHRTGLPYFSLDAECSPLLFPYKDNHDIV
mmetsp:Transcript_24531/g.53992  ORF Transcript_24531/g.53992 Transcript_24531/m.53992 type:complete len:207 (+) Transcript_24531:828-1448(+)